MPLFHLYTIISNMLKHNIIIIYNIYKFTRMKTVLNITIIHQKYSHFEKYILQ